MIHVRQSRVKINGLYVKKKSHAGSESCDYSHVKFADFEACSVQFILPELIRSFETILCGGVLLFSFSF